MVESMGLSANKTCVCPPKHKMETVVPSKLPTTVLYISATVRPRDRTLRLCMPRAVVDLADTLSARYMYCTYDRLRPI